MQNPTWGLGSHDEHETPSTDVVGPAALLTSGLFATDAPTPVDLPAIVPAPTTRRELRELEARALREAEAAAQREAERTQRPLLFPEASNTESVSIDELLAGSTDADTGFVRVGEDAAASSTRPRGRDRRRRRPRPTGARVAGRPSRSAARRARSAARVPHVAAEVTATPLPVRARVAGIRRRIISNLVSVGAMAGVGLILIATTVPANAFSRPEIGLQEDAAGSAQTLEAQEFTGDEVVAPAVTRDAFSVVTQQQKIAALGANRLLDYTNNPNGTIQWPFPSGAPITSGFGGRHVAGCGFCSTYHEGLDFTPGTGTPINSIADGVVSLVEQSRGGLGNHVIVDHVINGQKVQSVYAHMQSGSVEVQVGQTVTVGQVLGAVGSTGASTGAHLHLEIHLDGTPVDPFAWLQANAN